MLASLVRALFRASSSENTKAVNGDMAGNSTMRVMGHEVDQQGILADQLGVPDIPEDSGLQREILEANIDALMLWESKLTYRSVPGEPISLPFHTNSS